MKVLLIGGTGLISTGIVKHLLTRGVEVTMFNRGERENHFPRSVHTIKGDRNDPASLAQCHQQKFDVVIDMFCFTAEQTRTLIDTFKNRCEQIIFCSTVCTYGAKIPSHVLIDETFPQEPVSDYGKNKVVCEKMLLESHAKGDFNTTIIRPSYTYGPGRSMLDNLEGDAVAWDRIEKGLPVLCAGDGLGLWVATHRDDCGKLFAYAAQNKKTYGESYNATRDRIFTWDNYYHEAARALGHEVKLLHLPASMIVKADPQRFALLREITRYHGAYSSAKAKRDVPEFVCEIDFVDGFKEAMDDVKRRKEWRSCENDKVYESLIKTAASIGILPE